MNQDWKWLDDLTEEDVSSKPVPFKKILEGSVYYPASGNDGNPIKYFSKLSPSFVYVDFSFDEEILKREKKLRGLRGYKIIAYRIVTTHDITPSFINFPNQLRYREQTNNTWEHIWKFDTIPHEYPTELDGDPENPYNQGWMKPFFACWTIWQRTDKVNEDHGPMRISLFIICSDGAATFDALYYNWRAKPLIMCFIRSDGISCNWTQFREPRLIMHRLAMKNPAGKPEYVYMYATPGKCRWPEYRFKLVSQNDDDSMFSLHNNTPKRVSKMDYSYGNNKMMLLGSIPKLLGLITEKMDNFGGPALHFHLKAIEYARDPEKFLSIEHIEYIYATLVSWGMHRMGSEYAQLTDFSVFSESILQQRVDIMCIHESNPQFIELASTKYEETINKLKNIFLQMKLTKSGVPIVANSKALAHIFPDLVPPIDRQYTLRFFKQDGLDFFKLNKDIMKEPQYSNVGDFNKPGITSNTEFYFDEYVSFCVNIHGIYEACEVKKKLVIKAGSFNSSIPKILDNLIITLIKTCKDRFVELYSVQADTIQKYINANANKRNKKEREEEALLKLRKLLWGQLIDY